MKTGIIGLILLLLVILGSFPTHARLINSVNVTCKSLDQKYKVGFNLSKASAKLFINNKEEGNSFTLTFPVCQSESSYFRFEQLKVKQYSFVYNKQKRVIHLFKGDNLKCNSKAISILNCK